MRTIRVEDLTYVILLELSKKKRKKPQEYLEDLIKGQFKQNK